MFSHTALIMITILASFSFMTITFMVEAMSLANAKLRHDGHAADTGKYALSTVSECMLGRRLVLIGYSRTPASRLRNPD